MNLTTAKKKRGQLNRGVVHMQKKGRKGITCSTVEGGKRGEKERVFWGGKTTSREKEKKTRISRRVRKPTRGNPSESLWRNSYYVKRKGSLCWEGVTRTLGGRLIV